LKKVNAEAPDFKIINGLLVEYTGSGGKVSIPNSVVEIDSSAFMDCKGLTEIVIPDSVQEIGSQAFYGCENLKSISIGSGVRLIGDEAFYNCLSLNLSNRQKLYEMLRRQWVNLADCLESQSEVITKLSNQIAGKGSDYNKTKAICNWVSQNIKYDYDYYYDRKKDVDMDLEAILKSKTTICAGYARLTNALLQAQGIPAIYVTGMAGAENDIHDWGDHAWSEAYVDGRWIIIDTTWGMKYFDMKLSDFIKTHQEDALNSNASIADIPSDWAKKEVWEAMIEGLIPADLQDDYDYSITREEFCELLVSLVECASGKNIDVYLKGRELKPHVAFTDTKSEAVLAAAALGFASAQEDGTFEPDRDVTRQEAAIMLSRAAKELGLEADSDNGVYSDEKGIASWAAESVAFVTGLEDPISGAPVMDGMGDGKFQPLKYCTTEVAIVSALRILHCVEAAQAAEQAA